MDRAPEVPNGTYSEAFGGGRSADAAFAAADTAIAGGGILWVDDDPLREWLRARGARSFSTPALLDVLKRDARIEESRYSELRKAALQGRISILPLLPEEILELASVDGFESDAPATPLTRPGWWKATYCVAGEGVGLLFDSLASTKPEVVPTWLYWSSLGAWRATGRPSVAVDLMVYLLSRF